MEALKNLVIFETETKNKAQFIWLVFYIIAFTILKLELFPNGCIGILFISYLAPKRLSKIIKHLNSWFFKITIFSCNFSVYVLK